MVSFYSKKKFGKLVTITVNLTVEMSWIVTFRCMLFMMVFVYSNYVSKQLQFDW